MSNTFPWSLAILERQKLLNNEVAKKINLKEYIDYRYKESLRKKKNIIFNVKLVYANAFR